MDQTIARIFADGAFAQLSALLGMSVFFLILGIREIKQEHPQGFFFLVLTLFFLLAHVVQLVSLPDSGPLGNPASGMTVWSWLAVVLCPAIIGLFLIRGVAGVLFSRLREAMVKFFFGLTLLCYIYMVGASWPMDVKGIVTVVWLMMLFRLELVETPE